MVGAVRASAQEATRTPHVVRVVMADGTVVRGAEVTFFGAPLDTGGAGDVARSVTDDSGRCRVSLLPTTPYLGWACRRTDAGAVVTLATERTGNATTLTFRGDEKAPRTAWRLGGLDAWKEHGPMRVRLSLHGDDTLFAGAVVDAEGRFPVPPLPPLQVEWDVFCGDRLVWAIGGSVADDTFVPGPQVIDAEVVDDRGQPVAGATIARLALVWQQGIGPFATDPRGERFPIAVSDAAGKARLLVAHNGDPFRGVGYPPLAFVAGREGHGECVSALGEGRCENGAFKAVPEAGGTAPTLTFTLARRAAAAGRLVAAEGRRPQTMRVCADDLLRVARDSSTTISESAVLAVGADGTYATLPPAREREVMAGQLVVPPLDLPASDPYRRALGPRTVVLTPEAVNKADIDLTTLVPLRLQVLDVDGAPAVGAHVLVVPRARNDYVRGEHGVVAVTNGAGHLVVPTLPGQWFVVVMDGSAMATATVDVKAGAAVEPLRLQPMPTLPVRVVDGEGKPVVGASFCTSGASWNSDGEAEERVVRAIGFTATNWCLQRLHTDADGRARLPFVSTRGMRLDAQAIVTDGQSEDIALVEREDPVEVVVRKR